MVQIKLKVVRVNEKFIVIELPRKIFKAEGIPDYITLKNIDKNSFEY